MSNQSEVAARIDRDAPLTDVHAHPSLKAFLFRRNLWRHYSSGWTFNPFASRTDFKMLTKGHVGVLWAAHYLPERQIFERCFVARAASWLLAPGASRIMKHRPFQALTEMLDEMEVEVGRKPERTELARSPADVKRIRADGKIAVVHAVEGTHALEREIDNLGVLARRGVAMVTLTHFYPNGVAMPTNAIPPGMIPKWLCNIIPKLDAGQGLTAFGRSVVENVLELGMLVDVTHCNERSRRDVYDLIGTRSPIVASHVGVRSLMDDPYNLAEDELRTIAASGGAVGIIFYNHWLSDTAPSVPGLDPGLANVWRTAKAIHDATGSWDHVMLGTDFDGFTDPIDDAEDSSRMPRVTQMFLRMGVPEADVRKIVGGNAQRLLEAGWTGGSS